MSSEAMQINLDQLSSVRRKINVVVPAETVDKEFSSVYENLKRKAKVKGFRPQKIPRSVLQLYYGDEVRSEVHSHLVQHALSEVIRDRGLQVVSRPVLDAADELSEGKSFTFSAVVEVKPEIDIKDYAGLEVTKRKLQVEESQVEDALRRLQEGHAQLEPVEDRDTVQKGDFVNLDFHGVIDGKPIPGGESKNYLLEVGSGRALEQFETGLVGARRGEAETIPVQFPEDYSNRVFAGKTATFSVLVHEIKRKVLPPLDDEFAKDHGDSATLEELRGLIRQKLSAELQKLQEKELKEQILSRLIEKQSFEVPQGMVEEQIDYLIDRHGGRSLREAAVRSSEERGRLEELKRNLEPQALRQVQGMLLLEKIAELEQITISESEIADRIETLAGASGQRAAEVKKFYHQNQAKEELRAQMLLEKVSDFLLDRAKVNDAEASTVDDKSKKG